MLTEYLFSLIPIKQATSLSDLRNQSLTVAFLVLPIGGLIMTLSGLSYPEYWFPFGMILLFSTLGLILLYKNQFLISRLLLSGFVLGFMSYVMYYGDSSLRFYCALMALYIVAVRFIIVNKWLFAIEHILCYGLVIFFMNHGGVRWIDVCVVIAGFDLFFWVVYRLINNQEEKLNTQIVKIEKANSDLTSKNEEVYMYNNIMAHDIKAPLRNITAFSSLVKMELSKENIDKEKVTSHLEYINGSTTMLTNLINDLLVQSKLETRQLVKAESSLSKLVEDQLYKMKYKLQESGAQVNYEDLGAIYADHRSLDILLNNLISNALKYQPRTVNHQPKISINHASDAEHDIISISDNGIGIKSDQVDEIFKPFKRLHGSSTYEGTGLGLSICQSIVQKHDGSIKVDSTKDQGTTFTIKLPKSPVR